MDSSLCPGEKARLVKKIPVKKIKRSYKGYHLNLDYIFKSNKYVSVYECNKSKYRFYFPFELAGDSKFYEHFQQYDWYYMPWKWEHEITLGYIKDGYSVLEVGCAHGAFLERISKEFNLTECVGLELNKSAVTQNDKWKIENETVETTASKFPGHFDLVCSYQVLEHIADVYSFLKASVDCLKIGGELIISVPNNDSFVKAQFSALNSPPHHMGLWKAESLKYLSNIFPLKLVNVHFEPLQEYHVDSYIGAEYYNSFTGRVLRKMDKILGRYGKLREKVMAERQNLIGHSIMIVFKKIN